MKSLQLDKPHAIVVIGIQGSGKTFFANKFADAFNAPFIEQPRIELLAANHKSAQMLMTIVLEEIVKTGRSIIIELTLASRAERTELTKSLKRAGYAPLFVWVQVDLETAINRSYRNDRIEAAEYQDRMRQFSPPHASERAIVVSGKHTFATQAKAVLRKLSVPRQSQAPPERPQPIRGQIIVR